MKGEYLTIIFKQCSICKTWFIRSEEYFYKSNCNSNDGLFPYCIKCAREKALKNKYENIDEIREKQRYKFRKKYKEKIEVRERQRKRSKQRRIEGKQREWQRNNPNKIKGYQEKRKSKEHTITQTEWNICKKYFNYKCAYCGIDEKEQKLIYNQQFHKDHVDHEGSNDISNCVPACKSCNGQKWKHSLDLWYNKDNNKYTIERYNKIMNWINGDYLISKND